MYKLAIFATILAVCSATAILHPALHYVAPHSAAKITKVEWEHKPVSYVVPAVHHAPVVSYAHKSVVHHAAPLVHAPVVHAAPLLHAPIVHAAPVVHHAAPLVHAAPLLHAPVVAHHSIHHSTLLAHKKA
ncbi:A-kinase anchor protein 14 [Parasteatoda tepidariorum]|uniref:A-kinase anchor protein 14 n=1 Tax=Parasteatoda tepidariorum TaxID=114398 RepID=UPI00077F9807|nr:cuticle protein 16.5 [Parasteatoda tepidariorum]